MVKGVIKDNKLTLNMLKTILIFMLLFFTIGCNEKDKPSVEFKTNVAVDFNWNKRPKISNAKDSLLFSISSKVKVSQFKMQLTNPFGSTLVDGIQKRGHIYFNIPKHFSERAGVLNYILLFKHIKISNGKTLINPICKTTILESYFGPQHIVASTDDFSMLVTIPTDALDNPNKKSFSNTVMFKDIENKINHTLKEIIHYKKVFSRTTKGKLFVNSIDGEIKSKYFESTILAANPIDYKINFNRNHSKADGKELTTISTSIIKDQYGNIIENGTLVNFILMNNKSTVNAYGKTINGIAITQVLHPKKVGSYTVTSFITGFANSNELIIVYK